MEGGRQVEKGTDRDRGREKHPEGIKSPEVHMTLFFFQELLGHKSVLSYRMSSPTFSSTSIMP